MTEKSPTVTCRSVCERLVAHDEDPESNGLRWNALARDARLALGQPDAEDWRKLAQESGEANLRICEQLDAANKRLDRAERSLRGAGWEDRGGEEWAPPIGPDPSPLLEQIAKANKRVSDLSDPAVADHVGALRREVSSLTHRLDESKRLASEWRKRAEDAENTIANQNALLARSSTKDVTIELGKMTQRAEEAEAEAVRLRKQRDGTDVELSKAMFLANWLLDRLVERSAV